MRGSTLLFALTLIACGGPGPDAQRQEVYSQKTCPDGRPWQGRPCGSETPPQSLERFMQQAPTGEPSVAVDDSVAPVMVEETASLPEPPPPPPATAKERARCATLGSQVNQYLATHRKCGSDTDCVAVKTPCGTQGACGATVSRAAEPDLEKLASELEAELCFAKGLAPCPSCGARAAPSCVKGRCEP